MNVQRIHTITLKAAVRRAECEAPLGATAYGPDPRAFLFRIHYNADTPLKVRGFPPFRQEKGERMGARDNLCGLKGRQ
jgi:hypothetical protein